MDIENFLLSQHVPSDVIQNFIANGITKDIFLNKLSPELLKELCPHIATRLKLSEIITANASTESNNSSILETDSELLSTNSEPSSSNQLLTFLEPGPSQNNNIVITRCFPDFDLKTLLQTSVGGNSILKFYETNSFLNNNKRNQLTDIVIKHIYTHIVNHKIFYEDYNFIAAKIISLFPKESIGTYFTNPVTKRQSTSGRPIAARGKLVDKVRNLLYKYGERKRALPLDNDYRLTKRTKSPDTTEENQDVIWLKANRDPWDQVIIHWKSSFTIRKNAKYDNIHDFYFNWPILDDPRSDALILIDFDLRYPESGLYFYLNFNKFFEKLLHLKQPMTENITNTVHALQNLDDDKKIPGQITVMTQILPPKGRINKKIKFSTQEALDSIFVLVENTGDIESKIQDQILKAATNKLPVQPYLILQGTLLNCSSPLLVIDSVKYKFNSISKAFDTMFKAYHVLDASYPKASSHIHLIIQRCIYKIKTKFDNVMPHIADILDL
ncbi:hypothetical protein ACJJTC_004215 [Scirpophaga incertulas]